VTGPPYSPRQRAAYLAMIDRIGGHWLALFDGEREFYSTAYWDLLTALWAADAPMRKTEALAAMTAVKSSHTAGKYLDVALRRGLVEERENPCDARSKLVVLAPAMKARLDGFLDEAVSEVLDTANDVGADPAADGDA
jgi:DNA-binding MarR family transcriptional regulator